MRKSRKTDPTKGGKSAAFALDADQQKTIDEFKSKAATLDADLDAFLPLAIKVKAIFAAKDRGAVIDGCSTFDEFVEKVFKKSARTVRSWLAQIGETDQRFANQPNASRAGGKNHYKPEWSTVVTKDQDSKSITLLDVKSFAHKAIRDGDENSAIAWMKILYDHGCKVWKQILIYVVEDIGLADLSLKADVLQLEQIAAKVKDDRHSDWLAVIEAVIRCCRSKKSRATDNAAIWFNEHRSYVPPTSAEVEAAAQAAKNAVEGDLPPIPDKAWDMHTAKGRSMGRGKDHFKEEAAALANKSEVVDFRPPAVTVPITLTDEQVRYLATLLQREQDSIAADLRAILAASIVSRVTGRPSKQDRQTKSVVRESEPTQAKPRMRTKKPTSPSGKVHIDELPLEARDRVLQQIAAAEAA